MRAWNLAISLILLLACGGGGSGPGSSNTPPPPAKTTYGIFRGLQPHTSAFEALQGSRLGSGTAPAAAATANTNLTARAFHNGIQMLNGKVLLVGGDIDPTMSQTPDPFHPGQYLPIPTMDIYDPNTETLVQSLAHPAEIRRHQFGYGQDYEDFALVNLPDGRVVIVGNQSAYTHSTNNGIFEIYDPVADTLTVKNNLIYINVNGIAGLTGSGAVIDAVDSAFYIGKDSITGNDLIHVSESMGRQFILDIVAGTIEIDISTYGTTVGPGTMIRSPCIQDANGDYYFIGGSTIFTSMDTTTNPPTPVPPQSYPVIRKYSTSNAHLVFLFTLGDVGSPSSLTFTQNTITRDSGSWVTDGAVNGTGVLFNNISADNSRRVTVVSATDSTLTVAETLTPGTFTVGEASLITSLDGGWSVLSTKLNTPREGAGLALLPGNKIGIYGGQTLHPDGSITNLNSVEIFDIVTGTITTSTPLIANRFLGTTSFLQTGYVLIAGGLDQTYIAQDSQLVHNNASSVSTSTGAMTTARYGHSATNLCNGYVLIAGGLGSNTSSTSVELYDPAAITNTTTFANWYMVYQSNELPTAGMQLIGKDNTGATVVPVWNLIGINDNNLATIDKNGLLLPTNNGNSGMVTVQGVYNGITNTAIIKVGN